MRSIFPSLPFCALKRWKIEKIFSVDFKCLKH